MAHQPIEAIDLSLVNPEQFGISFAPTEDADHIASVSPERLKRLRHVVALGACVLLGAATLSVSADHDSTASASYAAPTGEANLELDLAASQVTTSTENGFDLHVSEHGPGIENGEEQDSHIPETGGSSCSSITHEDVHNVESGAVEAPTEDLEDVWVEYLTANPEVAENMAKTSEAYIGSFYDALPSPRPSQHEVSPGQALIDALSHDSFTTAELHQDQPIINTYCDAQGNVHFYRATVLEAGTFVGGVALETYTVRENGTRVAVTKDGREIILDATSIVTTVEIDGKMVPFIAAFKAGIDTDNDGKAEMGCGNIIYLQPPIVEQPPETTSTTETPSTSTSSSSTSTSSTSTSSTSTSSTSTSTSTSTTIVGPKPTVPPSSTTVPPVSVTTEPPYPTTSTAPTTETTIGNTTTTKAGGNTTTTLVGGCGIACEETAPNTYHIEFGPSADGTETTIATVPLQGNVR